MKEQLKTLNTNQAKLALKHLNQTGLPNKKWESWKYTQITDYIPNPVSFKISSSFKDEGSFPIEKIKKKINDIKQNQTKSLNFSELVIYNGVLVKNLSNYKTNIEISQKKVPAELEDKSCKVFDQINLAFIDLITNIEIKSSTPPVIIYSFFDKNQDLNFFNGRLNINSKENANASIIEYFLDLNDQNDETNNLRNHKTECNVEKNSKLSYIKIVDENHNSHISSTKAEVSAGAHYFDFTLPLSGKMIRTELDISLQEENSSCKANGLFSLYNKDHFDLFSLITHKAPNTESSQLYKGVLRDESHGVFTAKILIEKNCNGCNSDQLNKNLLIGEKAHIHTRPQLEVYSDDVACAHGATTGQLGEEEIFYLQSRGIKKEEALKMLTQGFITDVLSTIDNEDIFYFMQNLLSNRSPNE